jgi:hypothetical protein
MRAALAAVVCVAAACSSKAASQSAAVAVSGMQAVPESARVVVSFDVDRLAGSQVVTRAAAQLVSRAPDLGARLEKLATDCKIDVVQQIKHVILALGDAARGQVLLVATGSIAEADLAQCLTRVIGGGGGTMSAKPAGGRTLYEVKDGNRTVHFAFGRADTLVIGTDEAWVSEAVGTGHKIADSVAMKPILARVEAAAPLWAAGLVDPAVGQGLVRASKGQLTAGPQSVFGHVDPGDGLKAELGFVMASEADAKALESLANPQLGLLAMAAQIKGLGPVVGKLNARHDGPVVRFGITLTQAELNQVLKTIDMDAAASQDAPPAAPTAVPGVDAGSSGD